MILGTGVDMVDIRRIEALVTTQGARFRARVFTPAEIALAAGRNAREAATLATRFAAKEACAKALGTGFRGGMMMREVEMLNDASGKPVLTLHGKAGERLRAMTPPGYQAVLHVAASDEYPYALVQVMIEARRA